jgi:hypothetical protein
MPIIQIQKAFVDRPSSRATPLTPTAVRQLRGSSLQLFGLILSAASMCSGIIFFSPAAVVFGAMALYFGQKWVRILRESRSGRVRAAECPNCIWKLHVWGSTSITCPLCRHKLLQSDGWLYDMGN